MIFDEQYADLLSEMRDTDCLHVILEQSCHIDRWQVHKVGIGALLWEVDRKRINLERGLPFTCVSRKACDVLFNESCSSYEIRIESRTQRRFREEHR